MKAAKTRKDLKEMPYLPQKKLLKEKKKTLNQQRKMPQFHKLGQLQEEISKAFLPVNADLSNDFKSIILETDQRKVLPFMRFYPSFWWEH